MHPFSRHLLITIQDASEKEGGETVRSLSDAPIAKVSKKIHTTAGAPKIKAHHSPKPGRSRHGCICCLLVLIIAMTSIVLIFTCNNGIALPRSQDDVCMVVRTTVNMTLIYAGFQLSVQYIGHKIATISYTTRNSSRVELGQGLNNTYFTFSQALATSNMLHEAPRLVGAKRREAMSFKVPQDSLILDPLVTFLDLSLHFDEDLLTVILQTGQLASSALRQQQWTRDVVEYVQRAEYWDFEFLGISLFGTSTLEELLYKRLEEHVRILDNSTAELEEVTLQVRRTAQNLMATTRDIVEASINDMNRLLLIKGEFAGKRFWLVRALLESLPLNEPEDLAQISQNVILAANIHDWALKVTEWLEKLSDKLRNAKRHLIEPMKMLRRRDTVKWTKDNKSKELDAFLNDFMDGVMLLHENNIARMQLIRGRHL